MKFRVLGGRGKSKANVGGGSAPDSKINCYCKQLAASDIAILIRLAVEMNTIEPT